VSRWSTDSLHAYCSPVGVWALERRGWRQRVADRRQVSACDDGMTWKPAVGALATLLAESRCGKLSVTLSSRFVQYRRIPWREDLRGDKEFDALARLEFANTFGAHAEDWRVVLSDEVPGRARIAAAVPAGLLSALGELAAGNNSRLLSVRPALTVAAANWSKTGDSRERWLVVQEANQLCFAIRAGGNWSWVRQRRVGDDWSAGLPKLLEEESCLAGIEVDPSVTSLFAPGLSREDGKSLREAGYTLIPSVTRPAAAEDPTTSAFLAWCARP
jgi:hypothetical protein